MLTAGVKTPLHAMKVRAAERMEIVSAATQKLKEINGQALSEGRCVELICADYLAGH